MPKFEIKWLEDASEQGLLTEIRRVAALMPGQRLTTARFNSHSRISASALIRHFGSWSEAKRRAGLADALPIYTDTAILDDLRRVAQSVPGELFTQRAYLENGGRYSRSIFKTRFSGWREALQAAGIINRHVGRSTTERMRSQPGRTLTNAGILVEIRDVASKLGKDTLTGAEIATNSIINQRLLKARFGSVSKALAKAGIKQGRWGQRHAEDDVFQNLLEVWTFYGRQPTHNEMDKPPSTVASSTYIRRYGGWRNALKAFVQRANSDAATTPTPSSDEQSFSQPTTSEARDARSADIEKTSSEFRHTQIPRHPAPLRTKSPHPTSTDKRDPTIGVRFKVLQRDRFRCQLCGRSPATDLGCRLHVDHIVPYSKGGKTTLENLQTLCSECNSGKANRPI